MAPNGHTALNAIGAPGRPIRKETGFKGEKKPDNHDNLREEFADVLNYLMELANRFSFSLSARQRQAMQ